MKASENPRIRSNFVLWIGTADIKDLYVLGADNGMLMVTASGTAEFVTISSKLWK